MIPIFLWARLQLFVQFSADFNINDIILCLILSSRFELLSDKKKCKHDPDVLLHHEGLL